jgi:hypothetical protein
VFPADSWLRSKSFQLVENKTFENVVLALIIVNSVLLAVDRPTIVKGSTLDVVLVNFDVAFAAFFTWEMVMKVCDMLRCVALRCVALRCVALRCVSSAAAWAHWSHAVFGGFVGFVCCLSS